MPAQVLDAGAAMPLYHQLADLLRRKIVSGEIPVGGKLPSESQLVSDYGLSRVTARQAVGVLVNEGLVVRGSGRGTRVLAGGATQAGQHFSGSLSDLIHETRRSRVRDVRLELDVVASEEIATALELTDPHIVRISRTRHLDGNVFAYSVDHLPPGIGDLVTEEILEHDSLMGFLAKSGVEMASARQAIKADVADLETAARLDLRPGDPVLAVSRVIFDAGRKPLYCVQTYYRGDRYTYTVDLSLNNDSPESIHADLA
jgi:GntR family transcriptional regulator